MIKLEDFRINQTLEYFRKVKVMSIDDLVNKLDCSVITVRRYLKKWHAITCYNKNARFYVLPDIPKFDEYGLWQYKTIRFSKHGNLTRTIIHLIEQSPTGMETSRIAKLVEVDPHPIISRLISKSLLQRKKRSGVFVNFSAKQVRMDEQLQRRMKIESVRPIGFPSASIGIAILVERIKYPTVNSKTLACRLNKQGIVVTGDTIENFFSYHGIQKKTADLASQYF